MSVLRLPSAGSLGKLASPTINWRDPINKRLVVANHVDKTEGRDLVSGTAFKWYTNSVGSAPVSLPARVGPAVLCAHDYGYWGGGTTYNPIAATDDVTVLMWAREDGVTNRGFFRRGRDGSGNGWSLHLRTENSACNPSFGVVWTSPGLVGRAVTNPAASINAGTGSEGMWLLGRYLQGRSLSIFCGNGSVVHDTTSVGSSMRTSTQGIALTGNTAATADNGNYVHFFGTIGNDQFIWARGLSDEECWDILADPMRVYRRPPTLVFFDSSTAGGGGAVTGDSAATVSGVSGSAVAAVAIAGSSSKTLANAASAGTGTIQIYGSSPGALGAVTGVATGAVVGAGSSVQSLEQVTGTATGVVGSPPITGNSSVTVAAVAGAAAGAVASAGASTGTVGAVSGLAAGTLQVGGGSTQVLGSVTGAATGVVGSTPISGTSNAALAATTGGAAGIVELAGTSAGTVGAVSGEAAGVIGSAPSAGASGVVLVGVFGTATGQCQIRAASSGVVGTVTAPGNGAPTLTSDPRYTVRASRGRFVVASPGRLFKVAA